MILPAAVPATPALSREAPLPAETPEISAKFAALLGIMLQAGTVEPAAFPNTDTAPAPVKQPSTAKSDDNSLPDGLPPLPATAGAETPELEVPSAIIAPMPQIIAPVQAAAEKPDAKAQPAVAVRPFLAQLLEGSKPDSPAPAQSLAPQPRAEQAPPVAITLPRIALPGTDEAVAAVPLVKGPVAPAPVEGTSPSTPAAPQLTVAVAEAPAASPIATAPPPVRPKTTHDFTTLVDRLVEARDTARAALAPQTVSASLAHAQFGDIAIRFEHGGNALSVALSNPDPEFARAVQAAAPAAQANDSGSAPQRQDAAGQHQAGSASGQSAQSQAQQRGTGSPARNPATQGHIRDEQQPGRSGIFA